MEIPVTSNSNGILPEMQSRIEDYICHTMRDKHIPGMSVGVVQGTDLVYTGYFGLSDMENEKQVDEGTTFRIGSISKTMTAAGLMQQWEKGKFNLDDCVNDYFPEPMIIPPHPFHNRVTFRHLLTHTSGGGEFLSWKQLLVKDLGAMVYGDDYKPLGHYLRFKMRNKLAPGVKWSYSNYGFGFLGYALEQIAGQPFHEYQPDNIFKPLGMEGTSFHHNDEILGRLAKGYYYKRGTYKQDTHRASGVTPPGNVYTTLEGLSKYVIALLNGGKNQSGSILKPETLDMMLQTHFTLDPRQFGWGLSFSVVGDNVWGHRVVGHGGAVPFGFTSGMYFVPEKKIAAIVLCNLGSDVAEDTTWGVLKRVLNADDRMPTAKPDKSVWPELLGYYGPEYRDFKSNFRLYMKNVGVYRIIEKDGGLALGYTWQGREKALPLHLVDEKDPYFFWFSAARKEIPHYISFKKRYDGKMVMSPGGLNEYIQLESFRKAAAIVTSPIGQMIGRINPLAEF